ncbi:acyl-CoA dehydrogenase family protein [Bradyrhizobium sp. 153]|uniref:acyl-CoA dehydrogenase family protein n=1 Tax=Bradyrhizobium sp. 153 TaxID=2782627 RepID=UPI001FF8B5B7|nr:acyl-CoA dehydrogenase family protein [Bradyrhizobium sp. 153]MCK1667700.1 acyl-CoA dehydrogenase family protein [Bradyrhizobium sp. 153]
MDFKLTPEDHGFQQDVRHFIAEALPPEVAKRKGRGFHDRRADQTIWQRLTSAKGWGVPRWPVEHGGCAWSPMQHHIWELECGLADAPEPGASQIMVGPVIARFGSSEMKARYLPGLRNGDIYCAQGFSEPLAGSDLAALRTRAERQGEYWVINGQKVWTTGAHESDVLLCLCRTDPAAKPQAGLSMIMVDMRLPGVTVRPIRTIDGQHTVNEIFLDDVRVPIDELIGEPNRGWTYAKFLLENERTYNAHLPDLIRYCGRILKIADEEEARTGQVILTEEFLARYAMLWMDVEALRWSVLRVLSDKSQAGGIQMAAASSLKIVGSELLLACSQMLMEVVGQESMPLYSPPWEPDYAESTADALPDAPGLTTQYLYWRASTIFGGSNDIQRQIIWSSISGGID